jgi:hypothetical protein
MKAKENVPVAKHLWLNYDLDYLFLSIFWQQFWKRQHFKRILMLQWMIIHQATIVGEWASRMGQPTTCKRCGAVSKSQIHRLWEYLRSIQAWSIALVPMTPSPVAL